ncbi:Cytochrome bd ubiquinol oxidase subunit 1 [bioreactor metagenome]|uniref:Cytochrome bd ubiquinol oxidase subunit 1 n=1 Tax=bioreactor metagenome TaxID=1076179 RepID=A0A644TLS6_9ZZZZ|nr:cytochrome ubiquinol oxidase subunit I [Negativicutes bacterium]
MDEILLARLQFGVTSVYHFLFIPLTLGLSVLIAIMETIYVRTGNEMYKNMAKFWGKLFLVNFSMGVVTGIVQEFHFGMNWSEYSRFMGDIFGAPLALEALTAFFLESTFLGLWIFGWEKLSKKMHAATIWIVALAGNLSAFWILVANSFMQMPTGYVLQNGRAEMVDFVALLTNPYVAVQFPHTVAAGLVTGGVFVMAISAYHLLKNSSSSLFKTSFKIGVTCALISAFVVGGTGHMQAQFLAKAQPMKLASVEALWKTADPAPFSIYAAIDEKNGVNTTEVQVPGALSMMVYNKFAGEIKGIHDLQAEYSQKYGPGDYIPPVTTLFWSFRIMAGAGGWLIAIAALGALLAYTGILERQRRLVLYAALFTLPVPYIANSFGWIVAEMGRQPWIVFGLLKVEQAVSPTVPASSIMISLIGFTVIYAVLIVAAVYLMHKFAIESPVDTDVSSQDRPVKEATLWN